MYVCMYVCMFVFFCTNVVSAAFLVTCTVEKAAEMTFVRKIRTFTVDKIDSSIDVVIYSIGSFEEIDMTYRVNFLIKIKWYDERITFVNLKDSTQKVID